MLTTMGDLVDVAFAKCVSWNLDSDKKPKNIMGRIREMCELKFSYGVSYPSRRRRIREMCELKCIWIWSN